MKNLLISTGNEVLVGEPIAKISSKMKSQLYFELRQNGKIVDPKSKVEIL
jgi:septal ring factor EnvC (AmiA/AmiB activator)